MSMWCKVRTNPRHFLFNWIRGFLLLAGLKQVSVHTYALGLMTQKSPITPPWMTLLFFSRFSHWSHRPFANMRNRGVTVVRNGRTDRTLVFTCRRLLKMSGLLRALCRIWMSLQTMSSSPFTTAMWRALQRRRRTNNQALFTPTVWETRVHFCFSQSRL